jgi:hypothetical protein
MKLTREEVFMINMKVKRKEIPFNQLETTSKGSEF